MKKLLLFAISALLIASCKQNKPINKCFVFNGKGDSVKVQIKYDTMPLMHPSWLENDSNNWYEKSFAKEIISFKNVDPKILTKIPILINSLAAACKASCKYPLTFAPIKNDSIHVYFVRASIKRPSEDDEIRKVDSMQSVKFWMKIKLDSIAEAKFIANKTSLDLYLERTNFIDDSLKKQAFKDSIFMMDNFKNELPNLLAKFKKDSLTFNKDSCESIIFMWPYSCTNGMGVPSELKISIGYSPYTLKEIPYSEEVTSESDRDNKENN